MADVHWLGTASDIKQVETITINGGDGGWATSDTATLTINGNDLTVTVGATSTVAEIAEVISRSVNANSKTDNIKGTETRNIGGQQIPEFTEVVATYTSTTVVLTGRTGGRPFTVTVSESTVGAGTLSTATTVAATGSEHWDNADNWSGGSVPTTDDVTIDGRAAASIKYGLDQSGASTLASLTITRGFAAPLQIGNKQVVTTSAGDYAEYRDTELTIKATLVTIGEHTGSMSGLIRLNLSTVQSTITVHSTGTTAEPGVPAVNVVGTNVSNVLNVISGSVGLGFFDGQAATVATIESGGTLYIGDSCTLTNVDITGGLAYIDSATTTLDIMAGVVQVNAGAHTTVNVYSDGTLDYRGTGTVTTLKVSGLATYENDPRARTVTNELVLFKGSTLKDKYATLTLSNGFKVEHGLLEDVTISLGHDRSYTVS